jgi:hypothetical protein
MAKIFYVNFKYKFGIVRKSDDGKNTSTALRAMTATRQRQYALIVQDSAIQTKKMIIGRQKMCQNQHR